MKNKITYIRAYWYCFRNYKVSRQLTAFDRIGRLHMESKRAAELQVGINEFMNW